MAYAYSTIQAGSGIIGNATGDSIVIDPGAGDRFGIGAIVIIWPSGQPLDVSVTNYETVEIVDRVGDALTVVSPGSDSRSGLDTWAIGDQLALEFPVANIPTKRETQVLTIGKNDGYGPAIDLGSDALGIVHLMATLSNVDLDGAVDPNFTIIVTLDASFNGTDWSRPNSGDISPDGGYSHFYPWTQPRYVDDLFNFGLATAGSLPAHAITLRYLRFWHNWGNPLDLGANATATIIFKLNYF